MEKKQYLETHYDQLRCALMCEPRGHRDMVGALILPAVHENAHFGVVFMDEQRWVNMCGHASIGCAMAAVETGMVPVCEPYTEVIMDTPAGIISAFVMVEDGRAVEATICNVPSFLYKEHVCVEVDHKSYDVSIAFGGTFFALFDASQLNIKLEAKDIEFLVPFAKKLLQEINSHLHVKHPVLDIERVVNAEFYVNVDPYHQRSIVIAEEGQIDRSPCGTGTSAKLAYLYATHQLQAKEVYSNESFTGATFKGKFEEILRIDSFTGIRPQIRGSAFITGEAVYVIDERDPLAYGFHI